MSYIVPRDRPTECRKCPFCDRYTYDCRLQRESYESFEEQIVGCPLTACAGIGSVRADAGGIYLDGQDATVEVMRAVMTYMILQLKEDGKGVELDTTTADRWQARLVLEVFPPDTGEEKEESRMSEDTVSRRAAIDAFLTELTKRERKNLLHIWSTVEVKYFVADMLEKLPSAQPVNIAKLQPNCNQVASDYISRQYLLDEYDRQHQGPPGGARKIIEEAPAIEPRPKGRWINPRDGGWALFWDCSECGEHAISRYDGHPKFKFCPMCGADMRGETE